MRKRMLVGVVVAFILVSDAWCAYHVEQVNSSATVQGFGVIAFPLIGETGALTALLQVLFHVPAFRNALSVFSREGVPKKDLQVLLALRALLEVMQWKRAALAWHR